MASLTAGHGRECITPPTGTHMMGYGSRKEGCKGIHDDLFVNAVALRAGGETLLLGYTDGSVGYLPTADAYTAGGYEPTANQYFTVGKPFVPRCEQMVKAELQAAFAALWADGT